MINKRLIHLVSESKKYIFANVLIQWIGLIVNIYMITQISFLVQQVFEETAKADDFLRVAVIVLVTIALRSFCMILSSKMGFLSSKAVKQKLRGMIYEKLLRIGASYNEKISSSEVVQVSVEGVEQLETYFGAYLPQFFYSMLAPLTLFAVLSRINFKAALILLICVPLIPIAIASVQTFAKKLFGKYWGQYTSLGDLFLENIQGLTTLKIYQADEFKNEQMNEEAEKFRKITMRVLVMQLNSVTIMDFIAYGGAALGIIVSVLQFRAGNVSLAGCLTIILLSAEFFIPMRLLGSFFHIAMNGMAASEKIFRLMDLEVPRQGEKEFPKDTAIRISGLGFSYTADREILKEVAMEFPKNSFTAIVGESGSGKSTIAAILMGRNKNYSGSIRIGDTELPEIAEDSLMKSIAYIGHESYLFKGSVRENLQMGNPSASEKEMWEVLEKVNLSDFLKAEKGLETLLIEKGGNLSGGQRQRLALARAMLHDAPVYIFDEATSNIDVESENEIMGQIHRLAQSKTVILITHRLANAVKTENIYVIQQGRIKEQGNHLQLISREGIYATLWQTQMSLENFGTEVVA